MLSKIKSDLGLDIHRQSIKERFSFANSGRIFMSVYLGCVEFDVAMETMHTGGKP